MWVIRPEQLAVLDAVAREQFVRELLDHVREHFAARTAVMTDGELIDRIRTTIDRAAEHGLTERNPVRRFVALSIVFGAGFDEEAEWAARLLADSKAMDQRVRAELLHELGLRRLRDGRPRGGRGVTEEEP